LIFPAEKVPLIFEKNLDFFSIGSTFKQIRIIFTLFNQIFSLSHFGAIFTSVGASIDLETNIGKFQRFLEITHFQINQFTRSKYFFGFQLLVFGVFHQCENFSISSVSFSPGTKGLVSESIWVILKFRRISCSHLTPLKIYMLEQSGRNVSIDFHAPDILIQKKCGGEHSSPRGGYKCGPNVFVVACSPS
jgi:hypothetical protein